MRKRAYTDRFFREDLQSRKSAERIVPFVIDLISPGSVIDVGCGAGDFLSVFLKEGITDILGIDGEWVGLKTIGIPVDQFSPADLEKPFSAGRKFDLVISLEVAEHISEASADIFIDTLAGMGDVVLFSAAVPFQGGRNHINEKWPEYWASLFQERGYLCIDCLRAEFWNNPDVEFWYAQNMLFFIKEEKLKDFPRLAGKTGMPLPLVHPGLYLKKCGKRRLF